MNKLQETLAILEQAAKKSPSIIVAFSGGKDSLVVLDMCVRTFERVECFFMYLVPGLRVIEEQLRYAEERWKVKVHQYPHWVLGKLIKNGEFCPSHYRHDDLPDYKLHDIYALVMADLGIPLIATGAKRADSLWRRRMLKSWGDRADCIYPCIGWSTFDVLSYLKAQKIPVPEGSGCNASGIDLTTPELLYLYDHAPDDFAKLAQVFPYAPAVLWRREWYGVGKYKGMKPASQRTPLPR
jgi:phosphoadenosine phosphosulfate reductase